MRLRPRILTVAMLGVLGAALCFGFGATREAPVARVAPDRAAPAPPGVVLICLDTLRADALSLDSGRPVRMPRLEAFARESVAFADAVSGSAWTAPSVATLFTGLDSAHNGVYGLPERYADLSPAVTTLAERLTDQGWYASSATTGGWIAPDTGLAQGFRDGVVGLDANPEEVLGAWNRRRPVGAPFFLFVHSLAAHDPYLDKDATTRTAPPVSDADGERLARIAGRLEGRQALESADMRWMAEGTLASKASRSARARTMGKDAALRMIDAMPYWLDGDCETDPLVPALGARLHEAYLRSLGDVDRQVGRILDGLERLKLPAGTVVIVVGDHGEAFAEHGTLTHGRRLDDEMVRVPLLIHASDRLGAPRVVHGACGLVDVTPTILDLVRVNDSSTFDGISLVAAATAPLPERAIRGLEERRRVSEHGVTFERMESVRTVRAKCVVRRDAADRRLLGAVVFDLLVDPLERHPIPFEALDHPCEFGDAFAAALEDMGLSMPCREAATRTAPPARAGG